MTNNKSVSDQTHKALQNELKTWDALIGAHGNKIVQKFIIQQKMYAFTKAAVNLTNEDLNLERRRVHNLVKLSPAAKIKQYIDFIEGDTSLEAALSSRDNTFKMLNELPLQLANAS